MSVGKDMQQERIRLASELWGRRIGAEYTYSKTNPFLPEQMNYATTTGVPITVILAPRELKEVCLSQPPFYCQISEPDDRLCKACSTSAAIQSSVASA